MSIRVYIHGKVCLPEEARISVFDRGFLYGDSVYETIGTMRGKLFALPEHLDRLERSAGRIGLRLPPREVIGKAIEETVAAAGNPESRVRVVVTRGAGALDLDPASVDDPQLVIYVQPLHGPTPQMYDQGVAVEIVSVTRNLPGAIDPAIKSGNYLNNLLALGEARRRSGAHEAILCAASGSVAEGSTSNVFTVVKGQLRTPALSVGILDGITRAKVLELCRGHGIASAEVDFMDPQELRQADEAFITSAARGVLPVTRVDGRPLGDGRPGPVTRRLMALYDQLGPPRDGGGGPGRSGAGGGAP
jgi:branched-chain amino acid aminotransferase